MSSASFERARAASDLLIEVVGEKVADSVKSVNGIGVKASQDEESIQIINGEDSVKVRGELILPRKARLLIEQTTYSWPTVWTNSFVTIREGHAEGWKTTVQNFYGGRRLEYFAEPNFELLGTTCLFMLGDEQLAELTRLIQETPFTKPDGNYLPLYG